MYIFRTVAGLQDHLDRHRRRPSTIGFVPTMGALHEGHLSLVAKARAHCDITVCSVFVNPTQFNDPADLARYPRTEDKDARMLAEAGCDILFLPSAEEIYPADMPPPPDIDLGHIGSAMEGATRPGHFAGVIQVVDRLLRIVNPDELFMGQKDFQQVAVIRRLLDTAHPSIRMHVVPTRREEDGLAMSSRNQRLLPEWRAAAPVLYRTLQELVAKLPLADTAPARTEALDRISAAGLKPVYLEIVDQITLEPAETVREGDNVTVCVAAFAGEIRLIDNLPWPVL